MAKEKRHELWISGDRIYAQRTGRPGRERRAGHWAGFKGHRAFDAFTDNETGFISERDSFYVATTSETGWPYIQHRGGPRGFLKVLDEKTLGFADFSGNRQYISTGNIAANNRVCLFLMDYPRRARLKIYARAEIRRLPLDDGLSAKLALPGYKGKVERAMLFHLEAFDWNCAQHITPRFTDAEITAAIAPLRSHVASLESENASLRAKLAALEVIPRS
ncbi:MAG: pyridoxamine 5'-phosphate oxidase family protein [Rhodospirillaceae bacterium]